MSTTNTTRRGLFAGVPAIAVAAVPAAATALPDPVRDRRDAILDRHLDVIGRLDSMPVEGRRTVLTAVTDAIETSMGEHACDAELLALKPKFDEVFDDWWRRTEAAADHQEAFERRYPPRTDGEIDQDADRLYGLVDEILRHRAYTREGLRLQCRAMIIDSYDERHGKEWEFVASVATFLRMHDLPDALMADLYDWKFEDDEEEDGDDGRPDHRVGPSKGPTTKGAGYEQA
jgi:hypothetical protein